MPNPFGMPLGERIVELRTKRGLTQTALAAKAGLAQPTLNKIELGKRPTPRAETLSAIAAALGTTVEDLLNPSARPPDQRLRRAQQIASLRDQVSLLLAEAERDESLALAARDALVRARADLDEAAETEPPRARPRRRQSAS